MTAPAGQPNDATDTDAQDADNALANAAGQGQQDGNDTSDGADKGTPSVEELQAQLNKWKSLARKHEAAVKELKPRADKAKELEDKDKTEAERLRDQLEEAKVALLGYQVGEIRRGAAEKAGLPPQFAQFITATEPEAAEAQALELIKLASVIAGANQQQDAQQQPPGNFRQGTRGQTAPQKLDNNQLFHQLVSQNR